MSSFQSDLDENWHGKTYMPKKTSDIDFSNPLYIHSASYNGFSTGFWCVIPVEEIKIG